MKFLYSRLNKNDNLKRAKWRLQVNTPTTAKFNAIKPGNTAWCATT
ncbi:hypothetical protein N483_15795 [Pseudoalteromonas luteoviolacea NCIMB 1944]|nr:hypothetical protein N483_15795 [Pseudoalteromonas luteoviolacea NCIMB 1944]